MAEVVMTAQELLSRLVGPTIHTLADHAPNHVLGLDRLNVVVGTTDSPNGAKVSIAATQEALEKLLADGELRISPDAEPFDGYRRTSFIGAALAQLHGVESLTDPARLRLARESSLSDLLQRTCDLAPVGRGSARVQADEPLHVVVAQGLRDELRTLVADARFYATRDIPHDAVLVEDLRHYLSLYAALVQSLDEFEAEGSSDAPADAKGGEEAKRYRWHLRAEGRDRKVVSQAKNRQGYTCQVRARSGTWWSRCPSTGSKKCGTSEGPPSVGIGG